MCKLYLWMIKFSILYTTTLLFYLNLRSFLCIFNQKHKLSNAKSFGQMMSKLAIVYLFGISISFSWHELWTSGLRDENGSIYTEDYANLTFENGQMLSNTIESGSNRLSKNETLMECCKNVDDISFIAYLNFFYFLTEVLMIILSLIISFVSLVKLKNLQVLFFIIEKIDFDSNFDLNQLNENSQLNSSLVANNLEQIDPVKQDNISNQHNQSKSRKNNKKNFKSSQYALYLIYCSLLNGGIILPYIIYDISYNKGVNLEKMLDQVFYFDFKFQGDYDS
jgi:hypothetical protein